MLDSISICLPPTSFSNKRASPTSHGTPFLKAPTQEVKWLQTESEGLQSCLSAPMPTDWALGVPYS